VEKEVQAYLVAIGKIAVGSQTLDEVAIMIISAFDLGNQDALRVKLVNAGLSSNLAQAKKLIKQHLTASPRKDKLIALLDDADRLRKLRNENIHGQWQRMADAQTGQYAGFKRFRQWAPRNAAKADLNVHTPTIGELDAAASELQSCWQDIRSIFKDAWDIDEDVRAWREANGV
jgi:hypothetical protein